MPCLEEDLNFHPQLKENMFKWSSTTQEAPRHRAFLTRSCWSATVPVYIQSSEFTSIALERKKFLSLTQEKAFWGKVLWSNRHKLSCLAIITRDMFGGVKVTFKGGGKNTVPTVKRVGCNIDSNVDFASAKELFKDVI